jgi:hypothetical protein
MNNKCQLIQMRDTDDGLHLYLDQYTDAQLMAWQARMDHYNKVMKPTPLDKDQSGLARRNQARWDAHTSGNAYVLYVQARTYDHTMRVQAHGKNAYQAVRRYYKGLDGSNWTWQCTKVVAVYSCANDRVAQAGKLLHGRAQDRAPW